MGDAVISTGLGDNHPAVGVATEDDGAVDLSDRLVARLDVVVEVPERVADLATARQRHRDGWDAEFGERLRHPAPPPIGVADACAMNEHQSCHRGAGTVLGRWGKPPLVV